LGGPKSYKSQAEVKLQSGLVLALVKLEGIKVIQKSYKGQAKVKLQSGLVLLLLALVKLGGPKSYKSQAEIKLQSGLVLLLLALVKLGGTKVRQKSGKSHGYSTQIG
jgi:hypothetical protein